MSQITRRNAVLTAAAAGAAFGLDKPLGGFIGSAEAQKAPVSITEKGYAKFKVGDVEVIQVYDGMFNKPHDAAFIKNASIDDTKAALKKAGLKDDAVPITFTVTFVRTKGKLVMFDSSTGGQLAPTAGLMMAKNMYAAGIDPQKISTIVVTHFHGDHILGMISKETNSRVFPDAEIVVPAAELKYWNDPALPGKAPDSQKGARYSAGWGQGRDFASQGGFCGRLRTARGRTARKTGCASRTAHRASTLRGASNRDPPIHAG